MIRRQSSRDMSVTFANRPMPALFTRRPTPPKGRTVPSTSRWASAGSRTSARTASTFPSWRAAAWSSPSLRALIATCMPRSRNARAIASPIPFDPPVTMPTTQLQHKPREAKPPGLGYTATHVDHCDHRRRAARRRARAHAGRARPRRRSAADRSRGACRRRQGARYPPVVAGRAVQYARDGRHHMPAPREPTRSCWPTWCPEGIGGETGLALLRQLGRMETTAPFLFAGGLQRELMTRAIAELHLAPRRCWGPPRSRSNRPYAP